MAARALKVLPTPAYLRECLDYNPATGVFRWRERPPAQFNAVMEYRRWNARYAGTIAGGVMPGGYIRIYLDHEGFQAHRLAWLLTYGPPVPAIIDHIDGNGGNNRPHNLREADPSGNIANSRYRGGTISGVKGVYLQRNGKFVARVVKNRVPHSLGAYSTVEEAAAARQEGATRLMGVFARHT